MNYEEIVNFLESQTKFHDIEYLRNVLNMLDLKIEPEKVMLVAGTNGKGTTSATIATLLIAAGREVGFFSSPHLKKVTERIKFNNVDISEKEFCDVFTQVRKKIKSSNLSHFEWLTLMAAYYFFEKKKVDSAIFEVGMGGTYDSTNIIPHKFCAITRLALDHEDILGNSLIEIAENKFGIITENAVVFHTAFDAEIEKLSKKYAKKRNANFIKACDFSLEADQSSKYPIFFVRTPFGRFKMNLPGRRAAENSALALTAFDYLLGAADKYGSAIEKVNWPGRMQLIRYGNHDIFLSGDHNPNGVQSLLEILRYYRFRAVHFVVGICKTKDHKKMLDMLFNFPNANVYLTETAYNALPIDKYGSESLKRAKFALPDQKAALDAAVANASNEDLIIVTGSLYLVGKILSFI